MPPPVLIHAEDEATQIFSKAGIVLAWFNCWPQNAQAAPACELPFGPTDLMVRILSEPMADHFGLSPSTLGIALPSAEGRGV